MKSDLDDLMQTHDLEALLVIGPAQHNSSMYYFTGNVLVDGALVKKRMQEPVLFCHPMERDEAARTGLPTSSLAEYDFIELLKEAEGDRITAHALLHQRMLSDLGMTSGRLAVFGQIDAGLAYGAFSELGRLLPDLEVVGRWGDSLLMEARTTKDEAEVERIRAMGRITVEVVGEVADFLTSHKARDGLLVRADGEPLTVGEVKRKINLWLAERGAQNPEGTIFAIGRDAGVPHSAGKADDPLRLGQTIIFDIFPCEAGGGYFYDCTRTWCLGHAPDEAQALYDDVRAVYDRVMDELEAGERCDTYQERTCELFEKRGHATIRQDHKLEEGYIHSLGHGLGLDVHERPYFRTGAATEKDRLDPGVVATIEPGLYYPSRGMGCRLEDTVYVRPDGTVEVLAEYPLDLVLPVKG